MIGRTRIACVLALLFLPYALPAQRIADDSLHALIQKGIHLSGLQQYDGARSVFDRAIKEFPKHPAGYLNKAILLQVISLDLEVPVQMPAYLQLLESTRTLGEKMTAHATLRAEGNYYIGMARSYIAYYHFRDGEDWISGLSEGLKATGFLEDCLESQPRAYDAMTGVGTYKYWKSKNMSFLTWTPLVDDERETGIRMLRRAERHAHYTAQQATNSLIWIYIEEENWKAATRTANDVLGRFPKNRLFLWGLASAEEGREKWRAARDAYRRIVSSIDDEVSDSRYIELQARAKIALMSALLGDTETAAREIRWVLSKRSMSLKGLTEDGRDRIQRRFEEIEELKEEM
jgi:tetratricopeptide (TPR) repeat protein